MDTITQEDISMFSQMFSKLSNIIVQASDLSVQVPALQSQIAGLREDCEIIRKRNQELDEELFNVRKQRDEAQATANDLRFNLDQSKDAHGITQEELRAARDAVRTLSDEVASLKKERDDYGFRNMELQDQLDKANATLAKFRDLLGNAFPEPAPSSVPVQDHTPTVEAVPVTASEPATKRIYRYDENGNAYNQAYDHERFVNNRPHMWDTERNDYYVEVAA